MGQINVLMKDGTLREFGPASDPDYAWGSSEGVDGSLAVFRTANGAPVDVVTLDPGTWEKVIE